MRRSRVPCFLLVGFLCSANGTMNVAAAQDQKVRGSAVDYRQNREVLILYKVGQVDQARRQAEQAGFEVLEDYKPGHFLRCAPRQGVAAVAAAKVNEVAASAAVRIVEPNYIVSIPRPPIEQADGVAVARRRAPSGRREGQARTQATTPNDTRFSELWGLTNIRPPLAWETKHDSPVVVAIIDTGVDYTHEDLKANMWRNPGESGSGKETNGRMTTATASRTTCSGPSSPTASAPATRRTTTSTAPIAPGPSGQSAITASGSSGSTGKSRSWP